MIDENTFGVLVSWYDIEDAEYGMEPEEFAERWREFGSAWRDALTVFQLGEGAHALDLGHAVYIEIADGDQTEDPIVWLKMVRARIAEKGFTTVGVVSHGGRFRELPHRTATARFRSSWLRIRAKPSGVRSSPRPRVTKTKSFHPMAGVPASTSTPR